MFFKLLLLFTVIPVVELYLLVEIGGQIGTLYTIAIVVVTGIAGAAFAKSQGAQVLYNIRTAWSRGEMPGRQLVEGAMVLAGGILLLTPGFMTDIFGFSLLFPITRKFYTKLAIAYFEKRVRSGQWQMTTQNPNIHPNNYPDDYTDDH